MRLVCFGFLLAGAALSGACQEKPAYDAASDSQRRDLEVKASLATAPDSTLAHFLDMSIATRNMQGVRLDSILTCREDENADRVVWVADWKIDSTDVEGDSATFLVRLTIAARFDAVDSGLRGRLQVEEVSASMPLHRVSGRWKVCLSLRETLPPRRTFSVGYPVPITSWPPGEGSTQTAFAAIDSIRRARGLQPVR